MTIQLSPLIRSDGKGSGELSLNLSSDLSAPLLQSLPACGKIWAFARMCDRTGRGYASFTFEQAEQYLGVARQSIRRYVRECLEMGLIRGYQCQNGKISFYYLSQAKAAFMRGLETLGAIGRVTVADLQLLKITATEIQAEALQRSSRFAVAKNLEIKIGDMPSVDDLLTGPSEICQGALPLKVGERYALFDQDAPVFGGSQEQIGKLLGVCDRTVRNRLSSDEYRQKKGLDPIFKKQAAIQLPLDPLNWPKEARECFDFGQKQEGLERLRYFNAVDPSSGKLSTFRRECNIYALNVELRPKRFLRKAFKDFSMSATRGGHLDQAGKFDFKRNSQ